MTKKKKVVMENLTVGTMESDDTSNVVDKSTSFDVVGTSTERLPVMDSKKETILRNKEITKNRNKTLKLRKKSFCGEVV